MKNIKCPLCGSSGCRYEIVNKHAMVMVRCDRCDMLFDLDRGGDSLMNVYVDSYAQKYVVDDKAKEFREDEANYLAGYILENLGPSFSMLEIGAGVGDFSGRLKKIFKASNFDVVEFIPLAQEICKSKGLNVIDSNWEVRAECETEHKLYDIVASVNLVEHLVSPDEGILNMLRALRPGGLFYMHTPNGSIDRTANKHWFHYHVEHVSLFSVNTIQWVMNKFNLELVKYRELYGDDMIIICKKRHD